MTPNWSIITLSGWFLIHIWWMMLSAPDKLKSMFKPSQILTQFLTTRHDFEKPCNKSLKVNCIVEANNSGAG